MELTFKNKEGEWVTYPNAQEQIEFLEAKVSKLEAQIESQESDSFPCVNDSHFTEFCCYLTGHDEKTVIQMYEDWKRYR